VQAWTADDPTEDDAYQSVTCLACAAVQSSTRKRDEIGKQDSDFSNRVVTASPDVTVSTNLGGWVNRRGLFANQEIADVFRKERIPSTFNWDFSPKGQHLELGIAEMNLFIMLSAFGLSHSIFGERLLPVGTLYDPFIERGLDALNYACYQDARFILVGTPSGVTLAPEGGAHQSIATPLIGMAQDGLASFEPAFVDELVTILRFSFEYIQRSGDAEPDKVTWLRDAMGGSVYLRLSTRPIEQPKRQLDAAFAEDIVNGGYWIRKPGPNAQIVVAYMGVVAPEAIEAKEISKELGVRYVLEGSVQRDQNRVRVNAQLIDGETGAHLWADRFEYGLADLFKLQDQVVARLANTLGYELVKAEAEKSARPRNPDAIDLTMRGHAALFENLPPTRDNDIAARAWFEQALKVDPNNANALAGDAYTYLLDDLYGWVDQTTDYEKVVLARADEAIALDHGNVWAYYVKSFYLTYALRRFNDALGAADAGLAVSPNFAPLYFARSAAETLLGRFEQAKSDARQALKLSPRDPYRSLWHSQSGVAELSLGHLDAAIDEYHQAIITGYPSYHPYTGLAAAYALAGNMDEAKSALAEARRLNPKLTSNGGSSTGLTFRARSKACARRGFRKNERGITCAHAASG